MALATAHMVAFANDAPVSHYHGTHHRVRTGTLNAIRCQLNAALHVKFIFRHRCKGSAKFRLSEGNENKFSCLPLKSRSVASQSEREKVDEIERNAQ
jgi:hypothetical protein